MQTSPAVHSQRGRRGTVTLNGSLQRKAVGRIVGLGWPVNSRETVLVIIIDTQLAAVHVMCAHDVNIVCSHMGRCEEDSPMVNVIVIIPDSQHPCTWPVYVQC